MKTKILLVEDDINLGDVLRDYLELQDYEVVRAKDGIEGMENFRSQDFDLLILDVMLPRLISSSTNSIFVFIQLTH